MMLTADMMIDPWNAFAERNQLESGALEDAHGLQSLTMKGSLNSHAVTLSYNRVSTGKPEAPPVGLVPENEPLDAGLSPDVTSFVLRAEGVCAPGKAGVVRVTRDPTPTFRIVASWFGGGDPTVGDRAFDDRYLIDAEDEALAREVLTPALRNAIKAAQAMDAEFTYTNGTALLSLNLVQDGEEALAAATAVLKAAAG